MNKYTESEYQKEYNEIIEVYEEQMKPLRNKWLIAFISVLTIIGLIILPLFFFFVLLKLPMRVHIRILMNSGTQGNYVFVALFFFVPLTYAIKLKQVIKHKKRRLKNLEDKKMQAVSCGNFDANA